MKKQYDLLENLTKLAEDTASKISKLEIAIQAELYSLKKSIVNTYDHESEVLYLVEFGAHSINFYRATKLKLQDVYINWYDLPPNVKTQYKKPKNLEEAELTLINYANPGGCEIRDYQAFGYFDDIKSDYDRIDWITEQIHNKKFLYEITKDQFSTAIKTVAKFYGVDSL